MGIQPTEFLMYYAAGLITLVLVLFWRRPRKGMRLRLSGRKTKKMPLGFAPARNITPASSSSNEPRSLNVVFNYNGHSWDAYEVLGLPAGSGLPVVEAAYKESLERVDDSSRGFMEAAFKAIVANRRSA
jgi:hypothetical protein